MVAKRTSPPIDSEGELPLGEEIAPNAYLLTPEEAWLYLNRQTQEDLGMSADEFVQRLKTDDFSEEQREHVWVLRMMVPLGYLK